MKLKVCGMKYQDNIKQVAVLQPDYFGFIFYEKSARYFDGNIPETPNSIKKVGVFVDAKIDDVIIKTLEHRLDIVQLHGSESSKYCELLKIADIGYATNGGNYKRHHFEIIKVFSIKNKFDFSVLKPYEDVCDYFLFDTKGKLPGGNGYVFNWDVLKNYPSTKPYFLSGGIGLDQLEKLKEFQKSDASKYCYAIDVNSKFEIDAGLKNIEELEKFTHELQH